MNQKNFLKIAQVLDLMKQTRANQKPLPFSIGYLTADRHRGTAGQYRSIKGATLEVRGKRAGSQRHRSINIMAPGIDHPIRIHLDAILYFNQHPVA